MKITQTRNYASFIFDVTNRLATTPRRISSQKKIRASMKEYGFLPFPLLVRRVGDKLKVLDGQNRLLVAKELGLPVYYVETERDDISISKCAEGQSPWNLSDYAGSFANQGNAAFQGLLSFVGEHQIPLAKAAALLNGEVANGANVNDSLKNGSFSIRDPKYAERVANLAQAVAAFVPWAKNSNSLGALSRFVRVSEFSDEQFINRVNTHSAYLKNQPTMQLFSEMYEEIYNHSSRSKIPLAFYATEVAASRSAAKKNK